MAEGSLGPGPMQSTRPITKQLGLAIASYEAGRMDQEFLFGIFQDAIDNGDILEPENRSYYVLVVMPLIDSGVLKRSEYIDRMEAGMNDLAARKAAEFRTARQKKPFWKFWAR